MKGDICKCLRKILIQLPLYLNTIASQLSNKFGQIVVKWTCANKVQLFKHVKMCIVYKEHTYPVIKFSNSNTQIIKE